MIHTERIRRVSAHLPVALSPMLAKASKYLPHPDKNYGFEFKWDGVRALALWDGRTVRLSSRNGRDITHEFPELKLLGQALRSGSTVLDGEIVAFDERGFPSFERLQDRMGLSWLSAEKKATEIGVTYMIFDVVHLKGIDLMSRSYTERRAILENLNLTGSHWHTSPFRIGGGAAFLKTSRQFKLEGIVAKRLDSVYEPGKRSGAWLKIKNQQRVELLIGGWTPGKDRRIETIGSLLLGYYDISRELAEQRKTRQRLIFVGKAGTGFADVMLFRLQKMLMPLQIRTSPFEPSPQLPRGACYCRPELIGEFEFTEWTHLNSLRHPSFKGLRTDKDPRDIVREEEK